MNADSSCSASSRVHVDSRDVIRGLLLSDVAERSSHASVRWTRHSKVNECDVHTTEVRREHGAVKYYRTQCDAPLSPREMFCALTDIARWPQWTFALASVTPRDGNAFELCFRALLQQNAKANPRSFTVLDRTMMIQRTVSVDDDAAITLAYSTNDDTSGNDSDGEVIAHLTALGYRIADNSRGGCTVRTLYAAELNGRAAPWSALQFAVAQTTAIRKLIDVAAADADSARTWKERAAALDIRSLVDTDAATADVSVDSALMSASSLISSPAPSLSPSPRRRKRNVFNAFSSGDLPANRYAEELAALKTLCLSELTTSRGWIYHSSAQEIRIEQKRLDDDTPCARGIGIVNARADLVSAILTNEQWRSEWDKLFDGGRVLETVDRLTAVLHIKFIGARPIIKPRDFVVVGRAEQIEDGSFLAFAKSIEHAQCPPTTSHVRGTLLYSATLCQPLPATRSHPHRCRVVYAASSSPNGYLPAMIVERVAVQQPLVIANIERLIQEKPTFLGLAAAQIAQFKSAAENERERNGIRDESDEEADRVSDDSAAVAVNGKASEYEAADDDDDDDSMDNDNVSAILVSAESPLWRDIVAAAEAPNFGIYTRAATDDEVILAEFEAPNFRQTAAAALRLLHYGILTAISAPMSMMADAMWITPPQEFAAGLQLVQILVLQPLIRYDSADADDDGRRTRRIVIEVEWPSSRAVVHGEWDIVTGRLAHPIQLAMPITQPRANIAVRVRRNRSVIGLFSIPLYNVAAANAASLFTWQHATNTSEVASHDDDDDAIRLHAIGLHCRTIKSKTAEVVAAFNRRSEAQIDLFAAQTGGNSDAIDERSLRVSLRRLQTLVRPYRRFLRSLEALRQWNSSPIVTASILSVIALSLVWPTVIPLAILLAIALRIEVRRAAHISWSSSIASEVSDARGLTADDEAKSDIASLGLKEETLRSLVRCVDVASALLLAINDVVDWRNAETTRRVQCLIIIACILTLLVPLHLVVSALVLMLVSYQSSAVQSVLWFVSRFVDAIVIALSRPVTSKYK